MFVIDLEEGLGRDLKTQIAELIFQSLLTGQKFEGTAEHELRIGIDIVINGDDLWESSPEFLDQRTKRPVVVFGDENDHELSVGAAFSKHDFLQIEDFAVTLDSLFEEAKQRVDLLAEQKALVGGDYFMGALLIKAELHSASLIIDVKYAFVAVAPGVFHAQHWFYGDIDAGQLGHGVLNDLPLGV